MLLVLQDLHEGLLVNRVDVLIRHPDHIPLLQDLVFLQQVVWEETDDSVSALLPEIESDLDASAGELQVLPVAHRNVLNIDYHKWHLLAESALLGRLLGILSLSRIILILAAESQVGRIEVLAWLALLAGLLAAVSASRVVAALIPILGLVALALASALILTAAPSAVLVLWVGLDFLFLRVCSVAREVLLLGGRVLTRL